MRRASHATAAPNVNGTGRAGYAESSPWTVVRPSDTNHLIARAIELAGIALSGASKEQLFAAMLAVRSGLASDSDASVPVFGTLASAHDHSGSPANLWKLVARFAGTSAGRTVRLYAGEDGLAITVNAVWNPASGSQNFSKDDNGDESDLLLVSAGTLAYYGRAPGAGTWTQAQWSAQQRGNLAIGDSVVVGSDLDVGNDLTIAGDAVITGDLAVDDVTAAGAVQATDFIATTGEFAYSTARSTNKAINVTAWSGQGTRSGSLLHLDPGESAWNVPLPEGATGVQVQIKLASDNTNYSIALVRQAAANFASSAAPSVNVVDSSSGTVNAGNATYSNLTLDISGLSADKNETYTVRVQNTGGGSDYLSVAAIQYSFMDPGPRNF